MHGPTRIRLRLLLLPVDVIDLHCPNRGKVANKVPVFLAPYFVVEAGLAERCGLARRGEVFVSEVGDGDVRSTSKRPSISGDRATSA